MKRLLATSLLLLLMPTVFSGQATKKGVANGPSDRPDLAISAWPNDDQSAKAPSAASISPASLDFRDQVVGATSVAQRITVTNTGAGKLHVASASVAEGNWEDFRIVTDTCTGATVDSQRGCVIDVCLIPRGTGPRKASLVLKDDAPDTPQNIGLTGNGINAVDVPPSDMY
jgi:hypothetical protein